MTVYQDQTFLAEAVEAGSVLELKPTCLLPATCYDAPPYSTLSEGAQKTCKQGWEFIFFRANRTFFVSERVKV